MQISRLIQTSQWATSWGIIKPATSLPHEVGNDIHGQGEDNGGVLLCCDGIESLEVAKLKSWGRLGNHKGSLFQGTGCIHLTLCCDHLCVDQNRVSDQEMQNKSFKSQKRENNALLGSISCVTFPDLSPGLSRSLRLSGHGPLQLNRQLHVFYLHTLHLDPPVVCGFIQVRLEKSRRRDDHIYSVQCKYTVCLGNRADTTHIRVFF